MMGGAAPAAAPAATPPPQAAPPPRAAAHNLPVGDAYHVEGMEGMGVEEYRDALRQKLRAKQGGQGQ